MNNYSVAPRNEALIKSGNKPSLVVPFRIIIHPFAASVLKENNRPKCNHNVWRETTWKSFGTVRKLQIRAIVANCSLTLPVHMQSVWINSLTINAYLASGLETCPFPIILWKWSNIRNLNQAINWSWVRRCE